MAIRLFEQVIAAFEQTVGRDHPRTLAAQDNLAIAYQAAGRADEAIQLHEQVLVTSERVLGAGHPDTLTARNNLAFAYQAAGQADKALRLHEQALAARERVPGDHEGDAGEGSGADSDTTGLPPPRRYLKGTFPDPYGRGKCFTCWYRWCFPIRARPSSRSGASGEGGCSP